MTFSFPRGRDRQTRRGGESTTVPPMDGALRPNQLIETAPLLAEAEAPDNLAVANGRAYFTSGDRLLALEPGGAGASTVATLPAPVSALAIHADGAMAFGLDDGRIVLKGGKWDGKEIRQCGDRPAKCPTALIFEDADTLILCLGSQHNAPRAWKRDLMERRASGSVWRVLLDSDTAECLADGLAYPYGVVRHAAGDFLVSESWRSRLVAVGPGGEVKPVLSDLPGYPARLAERHGGAWLCVFAPRRQLVEFVLSHRDYREAMIRDIAPDFWVAPSLRPSESFLEPLQGGALKQFGTLKPWAPTLSYGLVVRLDSSAQPTGSYHSRADGRRHGVTGCAESDGRLLVASQGGGAIAAIPLGAEGEAA